MKILHICISCFYIDDYSYQENILPLINKVDGHVVKIIASTETYIDGGRLGYVAPRAYRTKEGVDVIRIPYKRFLPRKIMSKLRIYKSLLSEIENFTPDVILFHGTAAIDLLSVSRYVKTHPRTKLYVDCHETFYNSARNWISRYLLHGMIYKLAFLKSLPYIRKVLYIGNDEKEYLQINYQLSEDNIEYFPLGGKVINKELKNQFNNTFRSRMGFSTNEILLVHTGKMGHRNCTLDLLNEFTTRDIKARLLIAGVFKDEIRDEATRFISADSRIEYLDWKNPDELVELLCSANLYLQPGSPSATLQQAICCGTPVLINQRFYPNFLRENGFYVTGNSDIGKCLDILKSDSNCLNAMAEKSYNMAYELLDYRKLAARLYS